MERLRYEAWAYAASLHIDQWRMDTKAVQEQVDKFKRQAQKVLNEVAPVVRTAGRRS